MQNGTTSEKTTTDEKSGVKGNLTFDDKVIQKMALCQILLMLVKKSYICLMKALNRTRLFSAFFEANDVLL
ncbi:hypothetical protein P3S54_09885 [Lactobacillus delbrueckii]|nr:hypothetical protein [Lactobacillus delbrueckii]MDF4030586.1 hypothetical protein [Lactobacillus delbrueckii]